MACCAPSFGFVGFCLSAYCARGVGHEPFGIGVWSDRSSASILAA
jgi:hypothetical protein